MITDIAAIANKALETEIFAAAIYRHLADSYPDNNTRRAFQELGEMEKRHVKFWADFLKKRGIAVRTLKHSGLRLLLYKIMFRLIGRGLTLRMMETSENQAVELYGSVLEGSNLDDIERQGISKILEDELVHEKLFLQEETRFESFIAHVREAVLGMNDGLVGTLSVTTGLAGASGSPMLVAIGGLIVGIGGGLSMGISSYTSAHAQQQVHEGILKRLVSASKFVAHVFRDRVIGNLTNRGYSTQLAENMAEETARDHRLLSRFIAAEEYGLREENLGNPIRSSIYAGCASIIGAAVPLLPYFFAPDIITALILSLIFAVVTLAITGFLVALLAYISPGKKISEMIIAGLGCAGVTYSIGWIASTLLNGRNV
ncbi:MAG: VIT1/CCC1 transporter family protein [Dehalococcoidales bacterium]|nr:VIT1/CCC1 transporter family protein [Dehalococcoidales bacterium]